MDIWLNENRTGFDYFFSNVSPWGLICKYQDIGLEEPVLTDNPSCWPGFLCLTNSGNGWFRKTQKREQFFGISSISDSAAMLPRALKNQFLGLIRAASQSSGGGRIVDRGGSRTTLQLLLQYKHNKRFLCKWFGELRMWKSTDGEGLGGLRTIKRIISSPVIAFQCTHI